MSNMKEANEKIIDGITEGYEKIEEGVVTGYKKIEDGVVTGYKKIETGVVEGYKKIEDKVTGVILNEDGSLKTGGVGEKVVEGYKKVEDTVVGGFNKMTDKFVGKFLTREGESVEEAKSRMAENQKAWEEKMKADADAREAAQKERIEASIEASRNAGKRN